MSIKLNIDKTGKNINNYIKDEPHVLPLDFYILKPKQGLYYTNSFKIYYLDEHNKYIELPKSYYSFTNFNSKLSAFVGMELCNTVHIDMNVNYKYFIISYQAYGGSINIQSLNNKLNAPIDNSIKYHNILNKPLGLPPNEHKHDCSDLYALEHLNSSIDKIRTIKRPKVFLSISKIIKGLK